MDGTLHINEHNTILSKIPIRTNSSDRVHSNFVNTNDIPQHQQKHVSETYDFCLHNKRDESQDRASGQEVQVTNTTNGRVSDIFSMSSESHAPIHEDVNEYENDSNLQTYVFSQPQEAIELPQFNGLSDTYPAGPISNLNLNTTTSSALNFTYESSNIGNDLQALPNREFLFSDIDNESQESLSNDAGAHSFIRKELLAALSHDADDDLSRRAVTPDTDSLSMATTASFDAEAVEDDSFCKSNSTSKTKQGRRTKKWLDDDGKEPLSYELKIGARILGEFMVEANRSLTWPFMNKVNPERDGVPDYYDHIKRPVWFNGMKEKFVNREYDGIDEFVSDFRTMLQNCYRYNGPDHQISKKAQRLETMLEQKLSLLSRDLREKIEQRAVASSSMAEKGTGSRRRRHIVPHDSTALLNQLRLEQAEREREARRMHLEERRQLAGIQSRMIDQWESTLFTEEQRKRMKAMCELPQVGHLLFLCQGPLNVGEIAQWELERCFLMPKQSNTMQKVMTALLSTPYQRASIDRKPLMPYKVWEDKLRTRSNVWYRAIKDTNDISKAAEILGIEEKFFKVIGLKNPLNKMKFDELSYYQRVWMVKALCEWCLDKQDCLREAIEAQPTVEQREYMLGEDAEGYTYIHFPQFCGADLRVYKQAPYEMPELHVPPPPSPNRKARKGKLSARWAAARRKLLNEKAREIARLEKLTAGENESKENTTKGKPSPKASAGAHSSSDDSDSGISHSDSDSDREPAKSKQTPAKRQSRSTATRQTRSSRKASSPSVENTPKEDENGDSSSNEQASFSTGRVTRSAWKKSIEEPTATPSANRDKSSQRRRKRNKVASRSPSPSPAKRTGKTARTQSKGDHKHQENNKDDHDNPAVTVIESSLKETKDDSIRNDTTCDIENDNDTNDVKDSDTCEETAKDQSAVNDDDEKSENKKTEDSAVDEENSMQTTDSIVHKLENQDLSALVSDEKTLDKSTLCDNHDSRAGEISRDDRMSHCNEDSQDKISHEKNQSGDVNTVKSVSHDHIEKDPSSTADEDTSNPILEQPNQSMGKELTCKDDVSSQSSLQSKNSAVFDKLDEQIKPTVDGDSDVTKNSKEPNAEGREKSKITYPTGTKSPSTEISHTGKKDYRFDDSSAPPFSTYCMEAKAENRDAINCEDGDISLSTNECNSSSTLPIGSKDCDNTDDESVTESSELHKMAIRSSETINQDTRINSDSQNDIKYGADSCDTLCDNVSPDSADKIEKSIPSNETKSNSPDIPFGVNSDEKEIAEIMMSMSRNIVSGLSKESDIPKSGESTPNDSTKKDEILSEGIKKEELSSDFGDDVKTEKTDVKDGEITEEVKEEGDVKDEEMETEVKKEEEDTESDLDEPEIKEPDYDGFELICETVEELRELTETFAPPSPKKRKTAPTRHTCEVNLYSRLAYLLKELEPWEAKLLQLNRRMRTKMKREMENYVEEQIKESMWESESSSSDSDSDARDDDESIDYTDPSAPALRPPRKKKPATPTPDTDRYMDQSEEYGYSSKGRMRKRRIIPNNAEDQCAPKKSKPVRSQKKPDSENTPTSRSKPALGTSRDKTISPSKMQHLIFQQPDGKRFTINDTQTLLLRAPSTTPGGPSQLIQIPGSVAVRNPAVLSQFLNSNKLGPGGATLIVQNNDNSSTAQVLKEHLTKRAQGQPGVSRVSKTPSAAQGIRSPPSAAFPAFEFKSSPTPLSSPTGRASETQSVAVQQASTGAENVLQSGSSAGVTLSLSAQKPTSVPIAASPNKAPSKHTPRILLSPKTSGTDKPVTLTQLPAQLLNQLPPNVIRQLIAAKQQSLQQQGNQPNQPAVNIAVPQQIALQLQGQPQGQITVKPQGMVPNVMSSNPAFANQLVAISCANIHVGATSPASSQAATPISNAIPVQKPKYSSNVTVKELLERQVASNMASEKGQGEVVQPNTMPSPIKLAVRPLNSGDAKLLESSPQVKKLEFQETSSGLGPLKIIEGGKIVSMSPIKKTPTLERSDTREAAEALISLESFAKENTDTTSPAKCQVIPRNTPQGQPVPMNTSHNPAYSNASTSPALQPISLSPVMPLPASALRAASLGQGSPLKADGVVQKVAVLKGGKSLAVVNAAKLQELIARKEAIDEAVKQVITEAPTTLPTVQIKVSSPYAMSGRQSVRPCTAATMALKHPIPAVPAMASLTKTHARRSGASTSVSASVAYEVSTSQSLTISSGMSPQKSDGVALSPAGSSSLVASQIHGVTTVTPPMPGAVRAPTALVSVKTTPVIHATEATPVSFDAIQSSAKVASTKPQTIQVVSSDKNMTYRLAQQGSSAQSSTQKIATNAQLLQGTAAAKQISPKGLNLAKLREQGIVLVRTANGQLQLMQTTHSGAAANAPNSAVAVSQPKPAQVQLPVSMSPHTPANSQANVLQSQPVVTINQPIVTVSQKRPSFSQENTVTSQLTNVCQTSVNLSQPFVNGQQAGQTQVIPAGLSSPTQAPPTPQLLAFKQNQLPGQHSSIQPRLVLQEQCQSSGVPASQIQTQAVSQVQQANAAQIQKPRIILQAPNQLQQTQLAVQSAVNQLQHPMAVLAGGVNQVQQPRLVLVNVNGQLMAQAVPQINAGAGIQAVNPAAAASGIQLLSQPATSVFQPAMQLNQQPVSLMSQLQLSQALNVVRPFVVQQGLQQNLQTPLVVPGANIQGQLLMPGAGNIQGPLALLQGGTGSLMVQGGGVMGLVTPQVSTAAQPNQVVLNINSVFQGQKQQ